MRKQLLLIVCVAACGGGAKSTRTGDGAPLGGAGGGGAPMPVGTASSAAGPSCESAAEHVATVAEGLSKKPLTPDQTKMGKLAYAERCNEDKWSAEVQTCFLGATTRDAIGACRKQLPKEQRGALRKDLRERLGRTHTGDESKDGSRGVKMSADPCEGGE